MWAQSVFIISLRLEKSTFTIHSEEATHPLNIFALFTGRCVPQEGEVADDVIKSPGFNGCEVTLPCPYYIENILGKAAVF